MSTPGTRQRPPFVADERTQLVGWLDLQRDIVRWKCQGLSDEDAHRVYTEGVSDFAGRLATEDQDGIARLCTMLGALVLSRATNGTPLSEKILTTAREALTANN